MKKIIGIIIAMICLSPISVYAICDKLAGTAYDNCVANWNSCLSRCESIKTVSPSDYKTCKANCDATYQNYDGVITNNAGTNNPNSNLRSTTSGAYVGGSTGNNATSSATAPTPGSKHYDVEIEDDDDSPTTCDSLFGTNTKLGKYIHDAYNILRIVAPLLLLGLSTSDFVKAIVEQDEGAVLKAGKKFVVRLVLAIAIFVVPTALNFIFKVLDINTCFL